MPLLCDMSLEEQLEYTRAVWSSIEVDPLALRHEGVGCPHCHMINAVPRGYDIQICICNECGEEFTVTKKRIGPTSMEFYDATL